MKHEVEVFTDDRFGSVRTLVIDNSPWFVGKDVAGALGYANSSKAVSAHVDKEDIRKEMVEAHSQNGKVVTKTSLINESGLYSLILASKLPDAKKFKRWVTSEVLPSIRKHGVYAIDEMLNNPDAMIAALTELKAERARSRELQEKNAYLSTRNTELRERVLVQTQQIAEMQPKVSYVDVVLRCRDLISISVIAKDYGWSAVRMNDYLKTKKIQYRQGKIWLLYQKYAKCGYTSTKTISYPGGDGTVHTTVHTYWTQKGRLFLYELLRKDSIFPLIEQENFEKEALKAVNGEAITA